MLVRLAVVLTLLLGIPATGWAVLAVDARSEHVSASGTSDSFSGGNVSGSATVVIFLINCANTGSATAPTGMTVTWDSGGTNQAAAQFGSTVTSNAVTSNATGFVFYRLAPTSGNKTVALSWTNTATCYTEVQSYTGGDTSTPLQNLTTVTATSGTTCVVTQSPVTPTGDLVKSTSVVGTGLGLPSTSDNNGGAQDFIDGGGCCSAGGRNSPAGGTQFTYTYNGTIVNAECLSVDVRAPGAATSAPAPSSARRLPSRMR